MLDILKPKENQLVFIKFANEGNAMKKIKLIFMVAAGVCAFCCLITLAIGNIMQGFYKNKICDASLMTKEYVRAKALWSIYSERVAQLFFYGFIIFVVLFILFYIITRVKTLN